MSVRLYRCGWSVGLVVEFYPAVFVDVVSEGGYMSGHCLMCVSGSVVHVMPYWSPGDRMVCADGIGLQA